MLEIQCSGTEEYLWGSLRLNIEERMQNLMISIETSQTEIQRGKRMKTKQNSMRAVGPFLEGVKDTMGIPEGRE